MMPMDGLSSEEEQFLIKFKPFINHKNIIGLNEVINEAYYHAERNANIKILMLDVSMQLQINQKFELIQSVAYKNG